MATKLQLPDPSLATLKHCGCSGSAAAGDHGEDVGLEECVDEQLEEEGGGGPEFQVFGRVFGASLGFHLMFGEGEDPDEEKGDQEEETESRDAEGHLEEELAEEVAEVMEGAHDVLRARW